jgi:hypothetical protein
MNGKVERVLNRSRYEEGQAMTWRERIAGERATGHFSAAARAAWCAPDRCPVGEGVQQLGFAPYTEPWETAWVTLNGGEMGLSGQFLRAMWVNDFAEADRILDARDDRVLAMKREGLGA